MDRIHCRNCEKRCYGEALRVQDFHFHPTCFVCKACDAELANQGFYMHEDDFFCSKDYLEKFGTRCHTCGDFVEGDVISALGNTYHQQCFVCANCRQPFPPGEQVTQEGDECFCEKCLTARDAETAARMCPKCDERVDQGQGLIAVDKIWHMWCFRCKECEVDLSTKYIVKDENTYCEKDFNKLFGIVCERCGNYIAGKVVQAGDSYFHADCSSCLVCGKTVGEDTDVFVLGSQVWHSECFLGGAASNQGVEGAEKDESVVVKSLLPRIIAEGTEPILMESVVTATPTARVTPGLETERAPSTAAAAVSPPSSANESPLKRPDSQLSTGADSAISCTTPTGTSSEADTPAAPDPPLVVGIGDDDRQADERREQTPSSGSQLTSAPTSRRASESSSVFTGPVAGEQDSYPSTPTPTPTPGVMQRTPSTSSAGSGGRIRPKSIAGVPMRSGSSLSSSSNSFNWKEMYSVDDKDEPSELPLSKSSSTIKSLAHGVVSPSTSGTHADNKMFANADRFLRRDSRPGSQASTGPGDKVSPTSPASSPDVLGRSSAKSPVDGASDVSPPAVASSPLSLIEEAVSASPPVPQKESSSPPAAGRMEKTTFPLADLQLSESVILLPKGVERSRLEEYLNTSDFEGALGMNRESFYKLQLWKQRELKRKAKLF